MSRVTDKMDGSEEKPYRPSSDGSLNAKSHDSHMRWWKGKSCAKGWDKRLLTVSMQLTNIPQYLLSSENKKCYISLLFNIFFS